MAKRTNFRVEVYPRRTSDFGSVSLTQPKRTEQEEEAWTQQIADAINSGQYGDLPDLLPSQRGQRAFVVWDTEED